MRRMLDRITFGLVVLPLIKRLELKIPHKIWTTSAVLCISNEFEQSAVRIRLAIPNPQSSHLIPFRHRVSLLFD
jgi:hypothetical protein